MVAVLMDFVHHRLGTVITVDYLFGKQAIYSRMIYRLFIQSLSSRIIMSMSWTPFSMIGWL